MAGLWRELLLVAAGGACGAVLRLLVSAGVYGLTGRGFPYGTLAVNLIGSLAIGAAYVLLLERAPGAEAARALILVGVLGAFTTFSTFALDTLLLIQHGALVRAMANVLVSVSVCIAAAYLGMLVARQL